MLRNVFGQLARTTAGYSFATLVAPLFTLVLTPIYTRVLGVADYGTVDTLIMLGSVFLLLGMLGLPSVLPSVYYASQDPNERSRLLSSALLAGTLWAALLGFGVVVFAAPLTQLLLARSDVVHLTQLVGIGVPFAVLYNLQIVVLRLHFAVWRANLLALLYLVVSAAANVLLVVWLRWGSAGVISANVAVNVIMGALSLVVARESLRMMPRFALIRRAVHAGLLVVPAAVAVWVLAYEDRLFLVRVVTLEQIGLYAIALKLASMVALLAEPFKSAWGPLALSIQQQPEAPRAYAKVLNYFTIGALGVSLALGLFAHEVLLVFATPAYVEAANYVPLLVLAPLSSVFQLIVAVGLLIEQRFGALSWTVVVAAAVNTVLNIVLIPPFGVWGAVVATVFACLVNPILAARMAQRAHPLPFEWWRVGVAFAVYLLLAGAGLAVGSALTPLSLGARALLLAAYLPLLLMLGVFETWELQLVGRAVRQPRMVVRWMTRRA